MKQFILFFISLNLKLVTHLSIISMVILHTYKPWTFTLKHTSHATNSPTPLPSGSATHHVDDDPLPPVNALPLVQRADQLAHLTQTRRSLLHLRLGRPRRPHCPDGRRQPPLRHTVRSIADTGIPRRLRREKILTACLMTSAVADLNLCTHTRKLWT